MIREKDILFSIIGKQKNCEFSLRFVLQRCEAQWCICFALLKLFKKGVRSATKFDYGEYIVQEKLLTIEEGKDILDKLFADIAERKLVVPDYGEFKVNKSAIVQFLSSKQKYGFLIDDWPMRFCSFAVSDNKKAHSRGGELLSEGLPYYPEADEAIIDFFELPVAHFSAYGEVHVVINDYRSRIESLKISFSRAEPKLNLPEIKKEKVVVKGFAQSGSKVVALKDIYPQTDIVEFNLGFRPERLTVALLSRDDNLKLDGKEYGTWRAGKGIVIERPKEEILFLARAGESQTLEYKGDIVEEKSKNDFIESVVSFSNSNRGLVLVGVSDDGKILGTENRKEDLQKMIHDCCDPPPRNVKIKSQEMDDDKTILVVEVPLGDCRPYQSKRDKNFYVRHNATDMRMERSELVGSFEEINERRDTSAVY